MNDYHGKGDPDGLSLGFVLVLGTVVCVALIFALTAWYNVIAGEMESERVVAVADTGLRQQMAEQEQRLTEYRWVDQKNGVVAVPIERAIEVVAREAADGSQP